MSKPLWTSDTVAKATGGTVSGHWMVSGLSIDTRSLQHGDLFVPLKDARDGHDFIPQAFAAGAAATLSENELSGRNGVQVKDGFAALQDLAVAGRERSNALRIGVTGSVGKTSVKEALSIMLGAFGLTHKSQKSFNNHIGAPITLATMFPETEYGVFELGMNHAGELTVLSDLVRPHIALITTVAGAHLANFENIEGIADAKAEIMHGLTEGGVLILNADNNHTTRIAAQAKAQSTPVLTFGKADADVKIIAARTHALGSDIDLLIKSETYHISLDIPGAHWVPNIAACMAVAMAAELDLKHAARALEAMTGLAGRGQVVPLIVEGKRITLIDDSYNANPTSMRAAFDMMAKVDGRKLAVLGDMGELGKDELTLHAMLAGPLEMAGVSRVIVTGECMRALRGALPQDLRAAWCADWEKALHALKDEINDGDTVLIKGSNAAQLGCLVSALKGNTA